LRSTFKTGSAAVADIVCLWWI